MQITAGRPKDLEKQRKILEAAKTVFLTCGYHGSSMNQIAKQAGVTKLTVYNHFQDKATLFTCAIEATCEAFMNAKHLTLHAHCDFEQYFYHACELALNIIYLPEAIKLEHLLLELAAEKNPLALQFYNASHQHLCVVWQDLFEQAMMFEFIQKAPVEKMTELILSLLLGLRHHEVLLGVHQPPTKTEQQQIIMQSIEIFLLKYARIKTDSNAK